MLTLLASAALLVGGTVTNGYGESHAPSPTVVALVASRHLFTEALWYGADKLESGRGWGAHAATEVRLGPLGMGAAYSYRDGGDWVKQYPWARLSMGTNAVRLVGEVALGGYNRERKLELRVRTRHGTLCLESRVFVTRHLQGVGYGVAILVGVGR